MAATGTPPGARSDLSNVRAASGLNVLAGIWSIGASFALGYAAVEAAMWNEVAVGAIVVVLAAARFGAPARLAGLSWANVVAGVWLVAAPFVCGYSDVARTMWNDVIVGTVVAALATASAAITSSLRRYHGREGHGRLMTPPPRPVV